MSKPENELIKHSFDGIQEYDNPMPRWLWYLFIITIIWAGVYLFYYHIAKFDPGQAVEYKNEMKTAAASTSKTEQKFSLTLLTDAQSISGGKAIYEKNCIACHGKLGEGGIGPNLTDDYWIHGGEYDNIIQTIINGVPEKSMIAWKSLLKPDDINKVASYIASLRDSNPPNAKAPQGELSTNN